jgi:hypothetical protein
MYLNILVKIYNKTNLVFVFGQTLIFEIKVWGIFLQHNAVVNNYCIEYNTLNPVVILENLAKIVDKNTPENSCNKYVVC